MAVVIAGLQRDVGDLVTGLAAQAQIVRGDGGQSLVIRMAINEQKLGELRDDLTDHRRMTEGQMERMQTILEKLRENSEQQLQAAAQQRAQQLVQVVGWVLAVITMLVSAMISLFKK